MMNFRLAMVAAASAATLFAAAPASAAVKTVNFSITGEWTILDIGMPFELPTTSPELSGWFSYDTEVFHTFDKNGETGFDSIVAVHFSPGTQTWFLNNLDPERSYAQAPTPEGDVDFWALTFTNITGPYTNIVQPNGISLYDGEAAAWCPTCTVTWDVSDGLPPGGVPEPSTWAMMIAGFGLVGAALRRRHALA